MTLKISVISYNIEGLSLETNYCHDQSLANYIIEKGVCLKKYLENLDADIICIQEYTPILNLALDNYISVKKSYNAIFFNKDKFSYIKHKFNNDYGLVVTLKIVGLIIQVCTHRLPPFNDNRTAREIIINKIDNLSKNKIFIFAADTNMRKSEDKPLDNLIDCFHYASITKGFYTLDKKFNPYFESDYNKPYRNRYDKIYCTNLLDCEQLIVMNPASNYNLIHPLYPYGNISDHYPILAILYIN